MSQGRNCLVGETDISLRCYLLQMFAFFWVLTDLYSHFLLVQTKKKKNKYDEEHETSPRELSTGTKKIKEETFVPRALTH